MGYLCKVSLILSLKYFSNISPPVSIRMHPKEEITLQIVQKGFLYRKLMIQLVELLRSQTEDKAATQMLATAGSYNQPWTEGTKGGSGVPRAWGGILGQKPDLGSAHVPSKRCSSCWNCHLRPREGG